MASEQSRTCPDCEGATEPVVILDRVRTSLEPLAYRMADDRRSFWTGSYPTAGLVQAFLCQQCGRIALYGKVADDSPPE